MLLLLLISASLLTQAQSLTITNRAPARNAHSAPRTTDVALTFDQPISASPASLSGLRVFSAQRGGLLINGRGGSTSVSGSTLLVNPATDFKPGETVFVTSTTAIQSTTGGKLSRGQVFQFTTGVGGSGRGNFSTPPPATSPDPTVGDSPFSVAMGDVDGDENIDMVTANFGNNTVSVRLNNGAGYFTAPATNPDPTVGNKPSDVALGDVDGDGDLDLVTANFDDNTVSVRLNNGAGNFTPHATNPNPAVGTVAGSNPSDVALGDVDGDGDLDLITIVFKADPASFNGNRVSVRFNNGSGNFAAANADFSFEGYPQSVALGDVNGDGYLDLVIGSITSTGGTVSVRLNNGAGTFTAPATNPDSNVGIFPTSIALGDLDGDSDLDLVTNNKNSNTVSVRLNNGVGTFTAPAINPEPVVGDSPGSVALGDVDGDGDLDLLVANSYSPVSVRLNDGTGNFTPPATNPDPTIGAYAISVALGDVDGDSDLDLLVASYINNTVSVRLNRSLLSPSITGLTASPNLVCLGSPVTLTASLGNITDTYSYTLATDKSAPTSGTGTTTAFRQTVTATGTGVQSFTLTVESNGLRTSATTSLSLNALPSATLASSGALGCAITSVTLTAGGGTTGEAFTYAFSGPGLSSTGLSNQQTVSQAGNYSVIVTNANGCTATASTTVESRAATFTVNNPASISGTSGQSFSQSFVGSGGTSPYSYSLASGSLPPGLSLSTMGVLSGTPIQAGSFTLTVKATDAAGCSGVSAPYVLTVATASPIRYVRAGASGSGDSWADASGDLQTQINLVGTQQVWVAQGTYRPTSTTDRTISFSMKNGVTIYGGFAASGNPTSPSERSPASFTTVLSGDIGTVGNTADNSYHVVNNPAGLTNSAILDGFFITGGNANGSSSPDDAGGGMINNGNGTGNTCSPLIRTCLFLNNRAANGGGALYNAGYTNGNSNPILINCGFQNNNAAGQGGAIYNDGSIGGNSNPRLTNCSFQANSAGSGGAISSVGFQGSSRPVLTNCVVWGNGGAGTFANGPGSSITTSYSLFESSVTGYNAGTGNLTTTTSPFVSTTDTRLNGCSPALNAGDNAAYTSANGGMPPSPAADLAGNARVFPSGGRIDMGAYEVQTAPGLTVIIPSVSTAPVGVAFSQGFTASGGTSPYSYSLARGDLPAGLNLATTGVLSGTPTQVGGFSLIIRVTDAAGCSGVSALYDYTLTVFDAGPIPTLTGFAASPGVVCVGSPVTFTATVGNTTGYYNYTLTNGLGTSLSGTPFQSLVSESVTASGTGPQTFTLTVRSNRGLSTTSVTTLTVNPLTVASLVSNGPLSCAQPSVTLTAGGGSSYTFVSGNDVLGTPGATNMLAVSSPGTYSVTVASASGCVSTTSTTVTSNMAVVTVSNPVTTTVTSNASFSQAFTASGGTSPYSYSLASGILPTGLNLASTGTLSGTPTQLGSFTFTVKATDAAGCSGASAPYILTVSQPAPTRPDLSPLLYARPTTAYGTTDITLVVDVIELNGVSTSGSLTLKLTKDAKVTLSLPQSATSVGGQGVKNDGWTFSDSAPNYYVLTTSQVIGAGDKLSVGLTGVLRPGATTGVINLSVIVLPSGMTEARTTNNADADKIEYFQQ
ncbi:beta strand repeat-containing protein [Spirosoma validum]|uniref:VCBS repeat-containing protein n=1 Tax=Spirosoma validum TaxID=2771355 RepID=A0A927B567_9BACT|nr:FG-GAP-like repeat-containing protein [Spirosoma validum]MBD2755594.1 VCBS repeat-containing protein [Spirosoma validum]